MSKSTAPVSVIESNGAASEQSPERGFAARLRDATKAVHREAERTGFMADLIRGRATLGDYALFLRNLVPIYAALEDGLAVFRGSSLFSAFAQPGLRRLPALLSDLAAIQQTHGSSDDLLLLETQAYAQAIASAASDDEVRLAAHAYARYLGDLSGGQILKPILGRSLGLNEEMLRFYEFPDLAEPERAKAQIRQALDDIPATGRVAGRFIDEAIAAFRHNIAMSQGITRVRNGDRTEIARIHV